MTLHAHDKVVSALAVSSAAGLIATASHDKYVKLWKWLYCFSPLTKLVCLLHYVYPEILSRFSTDTFVAVNISLQSALARKEVFRSWPREVNQMMSTFASKLTLLHTKSGWQCSYRVLVQTYKRCKFFFFFFYTEFSFLLMNISNTTSCYVNLYESPFWKALNMMGLHILFLCFHDCGSNMQAGCSFWAILTVLLDL